MLKIVLDTNVVIAMIARRSPHRWIFDRILAGKFALCLSKEILLEYEEVLARRSSLEVASNFAEFLVTFPHVLHTEIYFNWHLVAADPDDNKFMDCAIAANAFCIVSEDRHFQPIRNLEFPPLRVLTLTEFTVQFK